MQITASAEEVIAADVFHAEFKAREVPCDLIEEERPVVRYAVPVQPRVKRQKKPALLRSGIDLARLVAHDIELLICRMELYAPEAEVCNSVDLSLYIARIEVHRAEADK